MAGRRGGGSNGRQPSFRTVAGVRCEVGAARSVEIPLSRWFPTNRCSGTPRVTSAGSRRRDARGALHLTWNENVKKPSSRPLEAPKRSRTARGSSPSPSDGSLPRGQWSREQSSPYDPGWQMQYASEPGPRPSRGTTKRKGGGGGGGRTGGVLFVYVRSQSICHLLPPWDGYQTGGSSWRTATADDLGERPPRRNASPVSDAGAPPHHLPRVRLWGSKARTVRAHAPEQTPFWLHQFGHAASTSATADRNVAAYGRLSRMIRVGSLLRSNGHRQVGRISRLRSRTCHGTSQKLPPVCRLLT